MQTFRIKLPLEWVEFTTTRPMFRAKTVFGHITVWQSRFDNLWLHDAATETDGPFDSLVAAQASATAAFTERMTAGLIPVDESRLVEAAKGAADALRSAKGIRVLSQEAVNCDCDGDEQGCHAYLCDIDKVHAKIDAVLAQLQAALDTKGAQP